VKLDVHMPGMEPGLLTVTLYKNQVKINQRPYHRTSKFETTRGKKIGRSLEYTGTGNYVLNRTPVAQEIRAIIDKQDNIKLKSFLK
jgi:hypothetical protein